ncbi:transglutaminase superfamily protein [Flavobacterium sp. 270]|uniref:transglutaminase domain-containing protein n=1 Tax=Flavobacterium sp. 270 TaxID=2512114 RepID=UPI001064738E|nr:transglutaminase domain-containing protein [Flavobacterium sp. 270]TDW48575.1 transglutaminase superfamily protein [Flavobacterium sp. 270]
MKKISCFFILFFTISFNAQNKTFYRLIQYAEKTPESQTKNIPALSKYLAKGAKTKKELVQLIYYWIALNIEYDTEAFQNNTINDVTAETTFLNKKSVCSGYSILFKEICDNLRIKCEVINGYSKGYKYNGEYLDKTNHAWNAVKIYDKWEFIDATWGAGECFENSNGKLIFEKQLCLRYLLDNPEDFILEHLPENSEWQLLEKPITMDYFFSAEMELKRIDRNGIIIN